VAIDGVSLQASFHNNVAGNHHAQTNANQYLNLGFEMLYMPFGGTIVVHQDICFCNESSGGYLSKCGSTTVQVSRPRCFPRSSKQFAFTHDRTRAGRSGV